MSARATNVGAFAIDKAGVIITYNFTTHGGTSTYSFTENIDRGLTSAVTTPVSGDGVKVTYAGEVALLAARSFSGNISPGSGGDEVSSISMTFSNGVTLDGDLGSSVVTTAQSFSGSGTWTTVQPQPSTV